jgi:NADH-quinone oxidoreductase E subunit
MSTSFEFTPQNREKFDRLLRSYPRKRAAMLPTLHLVQEQLGYVSPEAEHYVAELLEVPVVDVREVLSFYTLYFRQPMGKHHIRLCMSISCWIRGCDGIKQQLEAALQVPEGGITADGEFSWEAVPDCLGACELAPMLQIDGDFEGHLNQEKIDRILKSRRNGTRKS